MSTEGPVSLRHLVLLFAGDEVWRSWGQLGETVRTGEPAWDRITGASSFEHMRRNPEFQAMFNRAMAEGTRNAAPGIAEAGGFDRFRSVVDVGGGDGTLLAAVLRAHAHLRGTVFDLAEGMDTAPAGPRRGRRVRPRHRRGRRLLRRRARGPRRLPRQERHPRLGRRPGRAGPAEHPGGHGPRRHRCSWSSP